ncbi:hypothetical protein ACWGLF_28025 [Streptomyces puniciscabiei]
MRGRDRWHHQPRTVMQPGRRMHPHPHHQVPVFQSLQHPLPGRRLAAQQPGHRGRCAAALGVDRATALPHPAVLPALQYQQQQSQPVRRRAPART